MGIERRLQQGLFSFILTHRDFYEDLNRYTPGKRDYRPFVETYLNGDWKLSQEGIWYNVIPVEEVPDNGTLPNQGFKIHVSATSPIARRVLETVVPLCVETGTAFKLVVDGHILEFCNSKNYPRASSGKFVTIYPQDSTRCGELLEMLEERTRDLKGPYILSDRPYRESRLIYYRYGGFRQHFRLNLYGEKTPMIEGVDGRLIADERSPIFKLPEGVEDPFAPPPPSHEGEVLLNGRYSIESTLRFSNSGGVYTARDRETGQKVVIKEARPWVNLAEENPWDAITTLKKEARVLEILQGETCLPSFIELFQEWEHFFLVEEFIDGILLSNFRALPDVGLIVQRAMTAERLAEFCQRFGRVARNLIEAVQTFHQQGVIVGDLSPDNIFVDEETLAVRLIDLEGAFIAGDEMSILASTVTTGFVSSNRLKGNEPTFEDDYYSLGAVLYSVILPIQPLFALRPNTEASFLESLARDYDLPPQVSETILLLFEGRIDEASERATALAGQASWDWQPRLRAPARISENEVRDTLSGITSYILSVSTPERDDRLWPADYRVFLTNPLSLAYGALGTALYLQDALGDLPEDLSRWIQRQPLGVESHPPGLFVGLAGVGWALHELGHTERAHEALDMAYRSPLVRSGPDLFYGVAGIGLASLYFWGQTDDEGFLDRAREMAAVLAESKREDEGPGCYWNNADGIHYFGFAHGGSGVAFFFLRLYEATGDHEYLDLGKAALENEIAAAVDEHGLLAWRLSPTEPLIAPYWRYGGAGVGSVLIRFWKVLGQDRYRILAQKAGAYAASKYATLPAQFVGLSGIGEFMLDLYLATGDEEHLADAWRLAEGILLYRIEKPDGFAFPGEELLRISTDFGTGSAGVGSFLSRLVDPRERRYYDFPLSPPALLAD